MAQIYKCYLSAPFLALILFPHIIVEMMVLFYPTVKTPCLVTTEELNLKASFPPLFAHKERQTLGSLYIDVLLAWP